ncbi:MAG: YaiI/YqxD family protein [Tepidanaerobacteraceae bacterium]
MKILIDADGCPVVAKTVKIAKEYDIQVIIVKNFSHEIEDDYATIITVDQAPDSADIYIVNNTSKGDIVITQDYGLAAMALAKEAICINQNGFIISSKNIDQLLTRRHINREIRRKHNKYTKFKKENLSKTINLKIPSEKL